MAKTNSSESRRFVCSLNGTVEYQTALLPIGDGVYVIRVAKKLLTTLELSVGDRVAVELWKDQSEYGLPLPVEFGELLRQDPVAEKLFHALTRGKQRTLLHIAGAVKSSAKRAERAIAIVNHLKMNNGKIDYKRLRLSQVDHLRR